MNPVIDLMKSHSSVRRFKEEDIKEEDLQEILTAGQMASSWKNFQSYSIILVRSQEKKEALYQFVPQEAIRQCSVSMANRHYGPTASIDGRKWHNTRRTQATTTAATATPR